MNKKVVSIKNRINENIPYWYKNVRIIGDGIDSRIVSLDEAKNIAKSMGLDLIEINGNIVPPILRIDNYEKMEQNITYGCITSSGTCYGRVRRAGKIQQGQK